jgi:hypothetical protein
MTNHRLTPMLMGFGASAVLLVACVAMLTALQSAIGA